jgi:hypothetical protein
VSDLVLLEAIGHGPDDEVEVPDTSPIDLLSQDAHTGVQAKMHRDPTGLPVYSCERWLRLRVTAKLIVVADIRFWIDNYAPNPGWQLRYGISDVYRKPSGSRSDLAINVVPTVDPGEGLPNVDRGIVVTGYSSWIVLQASWWGLDTPATLQGAALNYRFAWSEL